MLVCWVFFGVYSQARALALDAGRRCDDTHLQCHEHAVMDMGDLGLLRLKQVSQVLTPFRAQL
jgi:hypothetical protein